MAAMRAQRPQLVLSMGTPFACIASNRSLLFIILGFLSVSCLACSSTYNPCSKVAREFVRGKPTLESDVPAAIGNIFGTLAGQMHHYFDIARCSRKNLLHVCRGAKVPGFRQAIHPQPGVV